MFVSPPSKEMRLSSCICKTMPRLATIWMTLGLLGSLLATSVSRIGHATEFRTTSGNRTIVRTVSATSRLGFDDDSAERMDAPSYQPDGEPFGVIDHSGYMTEYGGGCQVGGCGVGTGCGVGGGCYEPICVERFWVELEFLLWWRESRFYPPLVTGNDPGILPDAAVLFGGGTVSEQARPGGRLQFGMWLDDCQCLGIGGRFVSIGEAKNRFELNSGDEPFFARPFFDDASGQQEALVIDNMGTQGTTSGQIRVLTESEFLAADAFLRCLMMRTGNSRLDFLFGYQMGRLNESLLIESNSTSTSSTTAISSLSVRDSFQTSNEFHGGHFGIHGRYQRGCWGLELMSKFGFGNMNQQANLSGATSPNRPNSGLLVQQGSNAGLHTRDTFSYMHDTGIKLFYHPAERIKLSVGYSLMFFSSVLRPGDQIDTTVDSRFFGPQPPADAVHPEFNFNSTHFYAHGLNLGLECRF
jgi:hypothetical protein